MISLSSLRCLPLTPSPLNSSWSTPSFSRSQSIPFCTRLFSSSFQFYLDAAASLLVTSSTFLDSALCLNYSPSILPFCVSSSFSIPRSLCIESGAAWLSVLPCWVGACLKGPRTLTHWGAPAMPEMPSPLHLILVYLEPLYLQGVKEKVKLGLFKFYKQSASTFNLQIRNLHCDACSISAVCLIYMITKLHQLMFSSQAPAAHFIFTSLASLDISCLSHIFYSAHPTNKAKGKGHL